jgi:putative component of toxin-antitoxin plasmid stabilization module
MLFGLQFLLSALWLGISHIRSKFGHGTNIYESRRGTIIIINNSSYGIIEL